MTVVFDAYARYYDLLYRDKDYFGESRYVASLLNSHRNPAESVLELGCGTGVHAAQLAQQGFEVHGVDMSSSMIARADARRSGLPAEAAARLSFSTGDLRTTRVGRPFDAVVSLFHVMSYQTTDPDLDAAFATARTHLGAGGLFLFDFWYGPAVLTQRPETRIRRLEDEEIRVVRLAEPVMHTARNVVDVKFQVFIEQRSSGEVSQIRETHAMRYFFLPELERLAANGFDMLGAWAWMTSRPLESADWAGCVLLRRRG